MTLKNSNNRENKSTEIENEIPKQTETKATHRTGFIGDSAMPKEKKN